MKSLIITSIAGVLALVSSVTGLPTDLKRSYGKLCFCNICVADRPSNIYIFYLGFDSLWLPACFVAKLKSLCHVYGGVLLLCMGMDGPSGHYNGILSALIIKITISSLVIRLKKSYFPLIH